MILGVFRANIPKILVSCDELPRMNFRKEDLNLGRLQKLRKEVFPDAPGDYEKALLSTTGQVTRWSSESSNQEFLPPEKKMDVFSQAFQETPSNTIFCSKKAIFLLWI